MSGQLETKNRTLIVKYRKGKFGHGFVTRVLHGVQLHKLVNLSRGVQLTFEMILVVWRVRGSNRRRKERDAWVHVEAMKNGKMRLTQNI